MQFIKLEIQDVILCQPTVFQDERGFFLESYKKTAFSNVGISEELVQDTRSRSKQGGLRDLHYQIQNPQGKLMRVVVGEIFDAAVDFAKVHRHSENGWVYIFQLRIRICYGSPGFAHGFYTLSPWAEILYKTIDYYAPQSERTIKWNDLPLASNSRSSVRRIGSHPFAKICRGKVDVANRIILFRSYIERCPKIFSLQVGPALLAPILFIISLKQNQM